MSTSVIETRAAVVQYVAVTEVSVPLAWYPRLLHGQPQERNNWRLIGQGEGIHWPDLDEDISAENILLGQPSGESQRSLGRWLQSRSGLQQAPSQGQPA
jgi:hypothetical protein